MKRGYSIQFICILSCCSTPVAAYFDLSCTTDKIVKPEGRLVHNFFYDTAALHYEIFTWETLKLALIFGALYGAAHVMDSKVHDCFYCSDSHKNKGCMSRTASKFMFAVPTIIALSYTAFVFNSWSEELSVSARVFASGLLPLEILKSLFKTAQLQPCLRPKCEFFDKSKQYYGGFPSGHMAFMAYEATYLGLEYGWKAGVPLGALALAIFAGALDSNRHFASQLIAGTGLGVVYGVAAHRVMNCYFAQDVKCDLVVEPDFVGMKVACTY